ncbi:ribosomal RNA small subunit methyltransferase D [mine drainage metagenome]|uniref:Ribosomal RNA small subunit methyltransferase D n=1 Tax=mine drainage metagenome TaxID=410659 RepID=A0A1J5RFE6_9ZZZZ
MRQTLFNWLGQELHGKTCLDLFAGSGALGFEALSRGSPAVVMVEQNPAVYRALSSNAALLNATRARLLRMDARQFLAQNVQRFEVIFLDPPYGQGWLEKLLPLLGSHLATGGVVYAEAEHELADLPNWRVFKHGKAGGVHYHLLKCADET